MTVEVFQKVTIGAYAFTRSNSIVITKSADALSDTASIKVPISSVIENKGQKTVVETAKAIAVGDVVKIQLGYRKNKTTAWAYDEFEGFVKQINPGIPLEIVCEDKIWLLRRKTITMSWKDTTLKAVIEEILSGTGIELASNVPDIRLTPFYLKGVSGNFALQKIKDEYGLTIYIDKSGKLYAGLAYSENNGSVKYFLNGDKVNVIDSNDLKYRNADDVKIKVKAISYNGNNTKTEVEFGDKDGSLRTLSFYNIKTQGELEKLAEQELKKLKFDGYEGKIKVFLTPFCEPGMVASIVDNFFPVRNGDYYVVEVVTTADAGGYHRDVAIGINLSGHLKTKSK